MSSFIVFGGSPLYGSVKVSGSKNAVLPILFASLVTNGISKINNVPSISDVDDAIEILKSLGASCKRVADTLFIDTTEKVYRTPDPALAKRLRASTYLIGGCLGAFGECDLLDYGGCNFSKRPIDLHLSAAEALGAVRIGDRLVADRLVGSKIELAKPSVGATVNAVIMASVAKGKTEIFGYAKEPHVLLLIEYLRSAGAEIYLTDENITVIGRELFGGEITVIGDMIEAGTYLAAGVITGGFVRVVGISPESLSPFISLLRKMGVEVILSENSIFARAKGRLNFAEVTAAPYPDFPTDLQPIIAPLFAYGCGGVIYDTVFPDRFGYLETLSSFGIEYERIDKGAVIRPSRLRKATATAGCLRGGAACLLCALCAEGESKIENAELLKRGYDYPVGKLTSLGASILCKK